MAPRLHFSHGNGYETRHNNYNDLQHRNKEGRIQIAYLPYGASHGPGGGPAGRLKSFLPEVEAARMTMVMFADDEEGDEDGCIRRS